MNAHAEGTAPPAPRDATMPGLRALPAATVIVPTLVAALCAAWGIGAESLWLDESTSVAFARLPWPDFLVQVTGNEVNQSLYYLLLRGWVTFGTSEAWVRGLSALFAVAAVPVFQAAVAVLFGQRTAIVAALLLAVSRPFVEFAQEARGYSLAILLLAGSALLLARSMEGRAGRSWAAYAVLAAGSVYAHVFAAFFVGALAQATFVAVVGLRQLRPKLTAALAAHGGIAVLLLPLALVVTAEGRSYIGNIAPPGAGTVVRAGYVTLGGSTVLAVAAVAVVGVAVVASLRAWRRGRAETAVRERLGLLIAWSWLLVPPVAALAVSIVKPIFTPRYFVLATPGLALVLALGVLALRPARLAVAALVVLLGLSAAQVAIQATDLTKEDWRGATAEVLARAQPGDGVIFVAASGAKPFAYYLDRTAGVDAAPDAIYPDVTWGSVEPVHTPVLADALLAVGEHDRVWLVLSHDDRRQAAVDEVVRALQASHARAEARVFRGVDVVLWQRAEAARDRDGPTNAGT